MKPKLSTKHRFVMRRLSRRLIFANDELRIVDELLLGDLVEWGLAVKTQDRLGHDCWQITDFGKEVLALPRFTRRQWKVLQHVMLGGRDLRRFESVTISSLTSRGYLDAPGYPHQKWAIETERARRVYATQRRAEDLGLVSYELG